MKKFLIAFLICLMASPADAVVVQLPSQGWIMPGNPINQPIISGNTNGLGGISASNQIIAFYGFVYQNQLSFRNGSLATKNLNHVSFSNDVKTCAGCTDTVRVSIQGVSTSAGPPGQPDGVILGGGNALATQALSGMTNSVWWTSTPNFTSPAVVSYGQLISVVFDFTAYTAGAFNLAGNPQAPDSAAHGPNVAKFNGASWTNPFFLTPNIQLEFDDGSVGTLAMASAYTNVANNNTFNSGSNPSEIGMPFQIPFDSQVDAICASFTVASASSTATIELTDNAGTPNVLASVAIDGHTARQTAGTASTLSCFGIPVQTLTRNTTYVVGVKATSVNNITTSSMSFGAANSMDTSFASGQQFQFSTRNGASWAASTTTKRPDFAVRVSAVDDGTGP